LEMLMLMPPNLDSGGGGALPPQGRYFDRAGALASVLHNRQSIYCVLHKYTAQYI